MEAIFEAATECKKDDLLVSYRSSVLPFATCTRLYCIGFFLTYIPKYTIRVSTSKYQQQSVYILFYSPSSGSPLRVPIRKYILVGLGALKTNNLKRARRS